MARRRGSARLGAIEVAAQPQLPTFSVRLGEGVPFEALHPIAQRLIVDAVSPAMQVHADPRRSSDGTSQPC